MMFTPLFFCQKNLHVEPAGVIRRAAGPLGNHILPVSRTVLRGNKRLSAVPELHGKTVRPQKTAEQALEAD